METNETPVRKEQPSQKYSHVTVETDTEEEETMPVERVVERVISRPITENIVAPYIIRETEAERETRTLSNEISGLCLEMENFQTNMQELLERRSEVDTTVFEEQQQQQLETQMAETQTRLNELQARYNAIPEEIRRSKVAKILGLRQEKEGKDTRTSKGYESAKSRTSP
ncbi:17282_t:CDS:2 [Racocetra persica]|uniref:17282_t:CDS:1 n=1 Tax=Racocetra persica TaxID=160502 RepID=A0ACA9PKM1_9GLOM|nr:17282_t:CDS:2 [Racocetra persica]